MANTLSCSRVNVTRVIGKLDVVTAAVCIRDGCGYTYIKIRRNLFNGNPPFEYFIE